MFCRLYRTSLCVPSQCRVLATHLVSKQQMFACQSSAIPVISVPPHDLVFRSVPKVQYCYFSTKQDECRDEKPREAENIDSDSYHSCFNWIDPVEIVKTQKIFKCTEAEAVKLHDYFSSAQNDGSASAISLETVSKTVKWLRRIGASMPIIIGNCHILLIPIGEAIHYIS